ncbi:MFS transporter [Elizabethkingia meningoseptica]|uniref:MFS transporter n=2 Tax=Elizabethkingia meningoseptica TaxID=238 RepID=A0A1V3U2L6_ELIME|nr:MULTISPECIES: MFS transporter [Elizabethkingia]AQX05857.1 MFS transporter permease [Elizabethkingia meningoseptica]AQX13394.1 MFS transporter permease [Elizabethkingia meningoseptica]AQX47901.1 MFS transporter permease [Elizabethkingia meningoseptica]EJK5327715.1 MFS transporter [Elizabethkingia meningoseptica]EOR28792.1 major facilitator family transporter [Elizabethkingia meningoseptica ATCC 13253 = NBRC 12535]
MITENTKNNKKVMKAWAFYDWANSVYSLVITSTIFPIYYATLTTAYEKNEYIAETHKWIKVPVRNTIKLFGNEYHPDAVYGYSLTISFFIVVLLSPVLSALADTIGNKKSFLQFFCYLGATSCMGLALFTSMHTVFLGLLFSITASVGFWGSLVFYNSFLPDIATPDQQDALSAKGYIYGYIGSVILVVICLLLIMVLAQTPKQAMILTRISFLITGAWWFGFSQYTFKHLPKFGKVTDKLPKDIVLLNIKNFFKTHKDNGGYIHVVKENVLFYKEVTKESFRELFKVGNKLFTTPNLKYFLISFFFYSVGMQTIFLMATLFGKSEINLSQEKLILTLIVIQIEAIFGAVFFSWLSRRIGNKNVISIAIVLWMVACLSAYYLNKENPNVEYQFYGVAGIVGLVMGGLQAMSRSTFSKLLPEDSMENTTYFSFYDVLEKVAIILGTFIFATLIEKYNNMRFAALSMTAFFAIGLIFIRFLKPKTKD